MDLKDAIAREFFGVKEKGVSLISTKKYTLTWRLNKAKGLLSALIEFDGAGDYSHIDVVNDRDDVPTARGARSDWYGLIPPGYYDRPLDYCRGTLLRQTEFSLEVTAKQYAAYWRFSDSCLKAPYDTRGLMDKFVFGEASPRHWRDPSAWWCSEQVAANCEHANLIERLANPVNNIEPGDCVFLLSGAGAKWKDIKQL